MGAHRFDHINGTGIYAMLFVGAVSIVLGARRR